MKKILLLAMLLVMSSIVMADNYSFKEINVIPTCVGEVAVKVENHNNAEDYSIAGCEVSNDLWLCTCDTNDTLVYLRTNNDNDYSLDIVMEYYINKTNSSLNNNTTDNDLKFKRTEQFNDIILGEVEEVLEPIDPPTKNDWILFAVLFGLAIGVFILIGIFFIKWLMTDNESDCDFTTSFRKKPPKPEEVMKEGIKTEVPEQTKRVFEVTEEVTTNDEINDILNSL